MEGASEREIFESMPVQKAVAALAVPTIISQIVSIIYNQADTFFIGQLGNPYMVAAATLVYPWFSLLTALGNLRIACLAVPLILMNRVFGLYGMIWTQLVIETIMIPVTFGMYTPTWRKLKGGYEPLGIE